MKQIKFLSAFKKANQGRIIYKMGGIHLFATFTIRILQNIFLSMLSWKVICNTENARFGCSEGSLLKVGIDI